MPTATASWTSHTSSSGRTYYYDRISNKSTWTKPDGFDDAAQKARHHPPNLQKCLDESPKVAALFNAILHHCGADKIPKITTRQLDDDDPLCAGGRGGGYCCASNSLFICEHPWTGCREMAYELSHALNACRGRINCRQNGMKVDGADCGYLGPPDVACSELRASYWTGRCDNHKSEERRAACMEWHARWATTSCYPKDEHVEAHVRWARQRCQPEGDDAALTSGNAGAASTFAEQAHRWDE